jgi:hypothetical protein
MNLVSTDPSQNPYAAIAQDVAQGGDTTGIPDATGMPASDPTPAAVASVDMADPDTTQTGGFLSSLESYGSAAVGAVESGVSTVYGAGKTVVTDVVGGTENAVGKVVGIGTGAISSVTMDIILVLAVVGIALVLVARSGAISVSR